MKNRCSQGFTIIELSIALAFLAILLIAIITLTLTAGNMYVKGSTLKAMNQSWRDIEDMMRRDMLATDAAIISQQITVGAGSATSGRVCLGSVSYVWNTADLLNSEAAPANTVITFGSGSSATPVRLARVVDPGATMCAKDAATLRYPNVIPGSMTATELLSVGGREVAPYSVSFSPVAHSGEYGLYSIKMTIGTSGKNTTQLDSSGGYVQCKPNGTAMSDFNYCSVNDFDMIVRVGGSA